MILQSRSSKVQLLVIASVLGADCGETTPSRSVATAIAVTTSVVREITIADRLEAGGTVAATRSATLSSRVVAPVRELRVAAGDTVRAGQVLVVLDSRELAATAEQAAAPVLAADHGLAAARTELTVAMSEHKLAASWHSRVSALHAKNSATTQELDDAEARLGTAAARLEGAKARIEQAGSSANAAKAASKAAAAVGQFAAIAAPFDGVITETLTDPGNLTRPCGSRCSSGGNLVQSAFTDWCPMMTLLRKAGLAET